MSGRAGDERWAPAVLRDAGEDGSGCYVLGLRETTDDDSWGLLFMECLDVDEQDVALGMDTYCLVVDPGQATWYGGVVECELTSGRLRLLLTEDAAKTLGMPTEPVFALALSADQLRMVGRGLDRVLNSGRRDAVPGRLSV